MTLDHLDKLFQLIVFLFAISFHESAHAWMANRCGDPTARMLGRVSLNPIRHIDPVGTILMPAIALFTGFPTIGWAKPTPVDPRNFRNPVRDDILTSVAGPVSNFIVATAATLLLGGIALAIPAGRPIIREVIYRVIFSDSQLVPAILLLHELVMINVVLGVFNLIPVPPLDGSHVLRHFMPETIRRAYDAMGWVGLLVLVYFGGRFLGMLIFPVENFFDSIILRF